MKGERGSVKEGVCYSEISMHFTCRKELCGKKDWLDICTGLVPKPKASHLQLWIAHCKQKLETGKTWEHR